MNVFQKIFTILETKEKLNFFYIFLLILIMTILETFSVGLVLPAIKFLVSETFAKEVVNFFQTFFSIDLSMRDVSILGIILIFFFFIFKFFFHSIYHISSINLSI
jgi:hypothetical protein